MAPMVTATDLLHLTAHRGHKLHMQTRRVLPHRAVLTSASFMSMCRFCGEGVPEDRGVGMLKDSRRVTAMLCAETVSPLGENYSSCRANIKKSILHALGKILSVRTAFRLATERGQLRDKGELCMLRSFIMTMYSCIITNPLISCRNRLPSHHPRRPKPSSRRFRMQRHLELEVFPKLSLRSLFR